MGDEHLRDAVLATVRELVRVLEKMQTQLDRIEARQKGDTALRISDMMEETTCPRCYDRVRLEHYEAHKASHR